MFDRSAVVEKKSIIAASFSFGVPPKFSPTSISSITVSDTFSIELFWISEYDALPLPSLR